MQLPLWVFTTISLAVSALAVLRGGRTERVGALILLAGWLGTSVVTPAAWDFRSWLWASILVDVATLAGFVWLALVSNRYWTIFASAFMVLMVVTHVGRALDHEVRAWAYATANVTWSYLLVFALAYGVITSMRRTSGEEIPRATG